MPEDRLSDALACYGKCIAFNSTIPEAHNNCAIIMAKLGLLVEAAESFDRAIALKLEFEQTARRKVLGFVLYVQGKLQAARDRCERAIALNPNMVEGHLNLARALMLLQDDPARTIEVDYRQSVRIVRQERRSIFLADFLVACRPNVATLNCKRSSIRAVSEVWKQPRELAPVCARLIKQKPALAACIEHASGIWRGHLSSDELFRSTGLKAAAADPLLRCLLDKSTFVADFDIERFLTLFGFNMLVAAEDAAAADVVEDDALRLSIAPLRARCFINEYIFSYTDADFDRAQRLRGKLVDAIGSGAPIPVFWVAAVAAYFPLHTLPAAASLLGRTWRGSVNALLDQHKYGSPTRNAVFAMKLPGLRRSTTTCR